jgi:c-di-GMP-binding flagellar brake protein YcgR
MSFAIDARRHMPELSHPLTAWTDDDSAYAKYLLHSKSEIIQVLRSVLNARELLTAYFDHGQRFFLTSIVAIQSASDSLIVDYGLDQETNVRALEAPRMVFVTSQDRVRVQFSTDRLEQIGFDGRPAFRASLPTSLLKLQRREYYRLLTPMRLTLTCAIPAVTGRAEVAVSDISVGGVGLTGLPDELKLAIGMQCGGCRIVLPQEGTVLAGLEVRSLQEVLLRTGASVKRAGCRFVDIPASQQAMIQRYIIRVERERLARLKGR